MDKLTHRRPTALASAVLQPATKPVAATFCIDARSTNVAGDADADKVGGRHAQVCIPWRCLCFGVEEHVT